MIKPLLLIARAQRGVGFVLVSYLLPFLLLTSLGEGYGLIRWGKWVGEMGRHRRFTTHEVLVFEAVQVVLFLLIVFVGAKVVNSIGATFHSRHTYTQTFVTVAYGLGPLFLLRLLDTFPAISPWVSWGIGMALVIAVLYQGVPKMMDPDPSHAFGVYFMSILFLLLSTGVARFITWWYLQGKFGSIRGLSGA
jgi:hypothetical protein